jgi:diacylglycerol kinase family enzyme
MDGMQANAVSDTATGIARAAARRILAVFNPAAGRNRRERFDHVVSALRAHGCLVNVLVTEAAGHAEAIARGLGDDYDVIAAAGGDGTVNEIVNGLAGKPIALGLIPLGTANVLADEISLPRGVDQLARVLACNGRRYGGPFIAAPDADLVDKCFHVVLMQSSRWRDVARYGVALVLGRIGKLSDVRIIPAREIVVDGVAGRPVQADGDIIARLPATISIDPEPLKLIFPG